MTIDAFSADPDILEVGEATTLSWQTTGATSCTLETGDGESQEVADCASGSVQHSYAAPGSYTARLTASTSDKEAVSRVVTVTVNKTEDADIAFSTTSIGLTVTFDASAVATPEGARYSWDFGDGASGEGISVDHTYDGPGEYTVTLTLSTSSGETRVTQAVSVGTERITLLGDDLSLWQRTEGGAANWQLGQDGGAPYAEVAPGTRVGSNDIETRESFGDFKLHLEFWVPETPTSAPEQNRGNSGVYVQGRYEVQILDSFGQPLSEKNDAGALYKVKDAAQNVSRPAETWQSYDITFRAARFSGGKKTEPARISVVWNGTLVQDNVPIPGPTLLGDPERGSDGVLTGPIRLQDHGHPVRYRNIWLEPL
jgi:PKD repeat protein